MSKTAVGYDDPVVPHCLVVANRTLGGPHLRAKLQERLLHGPCQFHLLLPATPPPNWLVWTRGEVHALAQRRLRWALSELLAAGIDVTGEVGDAHPLDAIEDIIMRRPVDEIILFTLRYGPSRWIRQELPRRLARRFRLPVDHVVAPPEPSSPRMRIVRPAA